MPAACNSDHTIRWSMRSMRLSGASEWEREYLANDYPADEHLTRLWQLPDSKNRPCHRASVRSAVEALGDLQQTRGGSERPRSGIAPPGVAPVRSHRPALPHRAERRHRSAKAAGACSAALRRARTWRRVSCRRIVRYRADRATEAMLDTISVTIPNRIAYLDAELSGSWCPVVPSDCP